MPKGFDVSPLQFALNQVNQAFPGVFNIPLPNAAKFLGIAPKTARNQVETGRARFSTILRGGKRYVPAPALAAVIAADLQDAGVQVEDFQAPTINEQNVANAKTPVEVESTLVAPSAPVKRKPGRPPKGSGSVSGGVA